MTSTTVAVARHVVAVPYPGRGHINPMLVVCRQLVAADDALTITVVVTEEWYALLASAGMPPTLPSRVLFATIPNVIPSEHGRGADLAGFFEAVDTKMVEAVERLLDQLGLEQRPDAIVADTFLTWGVAAGARRGIPVCSLWTQPATFFLALYHFDMWPLPPPPAAAAAVADGPHCDEAELSTKSLEQYVPGPGLSSVRLSDLKIFRSWERPMKLAAEAFVNVRKAQCVLFTSFYELEPRAIDRIAQLAPYPIYPIGPSVPDTAAPLEGDNDEIGDEEHRSWLDAQADNSVLYVSFGSHVSMPPSQFEEVAMGLRGSGVRFFWVARDRATDGLRRMCGDAGVVVPWCDQHKVLRHPSVGGFLSHCGWNSVLESVCAGVPLLAFPVAWDQLVNARMVADEWKIGVNLREDYGGVVSGDAISAAATKLMDLGPGASQEMRRRAAELREASRGAVREGGSSRRSLSGFVEDLMEGRLSVAETSH